MAHAIGMNMTEKDKLRKQDFVTSIVLICLSIGILIGALHMPMKGMYGGVQNNWYMSPALLPLIISVGLFLLSVTLLVNSITTGGASACIKDIKQLLRKGKPAQATSDTQQEEREGPTPKAKNLRLFFVVLMLYFLIFLLIPRVDFLISLIFFLFTVMAIFTINDMNLLGLTTKVTGTLAIVYSVISFTKLDTFLVRIFPFTLDILTFLMTVGFYLLMRHTVKNSPAKKDLRTVTLLAIIVPLLVTVIFRYGLLVPLPVEGLFFNNICNTIYYAIR